MKIIISKERYIDDIKEEFNRGFPYLNIEFKIDTNQRRNRNLIGKLKLGDVLKDNPEGIISINENNSIKQVSQKFADNFGLSTNFYRRSGNLWIEIKATCDWSLKQQNESGMEVY